MVFAASVRVETVATCGSGNTDWHRGSHKAIRMPRTNDVEVLDDIIVMEVITVEVITGSH